MARNDGNITTHKMRGRHGISVLRKRSLTNLLIRRIRTNLLYAKLRSLIPKPGTGNHKNTIQLSDAETPRDHSDSESCTSLLIDSKEAQRNNVPNDPCELPINDSDCQDSVISLPSVRIEKVMGSHERLMIRIITFKACNTLPSTLFLLLEQDSVDIVHVHRFFTGEKVFYTMEAKVNKTSTLDVDALKQKLYLWAGKRSQ